MSYKSFVMITAAFLILYPETAAAYLDPGTGSMVVQMIVGAIAGVGITLKLYWHKIARFFRSKKSESR